MEQKLRTVYSPTESRPRQQKHWSARDSCLRWWPKL